MALPSARDVHVDVALTDLSVTYRQEAPAYAERIFPAVPVMNQSNKYYIWDKGDMWRRTAQERAAGTKFARGGARLSTDSYYSKQYALEHVIADEIRRNSDAAIDPERAGVNFLVDQINLEKDYQWAATYMAGSGTGWTAGSLGGGGKWDTSTGAPVTDVQYWRSLIRQQVGASTGVRFVGVCGAIVKARLMGNAQIRSSNIYVNTGTADAIDRSLAAVLGIDDLVVFDRVHNTAAEGKTASYSPLVDDDFLLVAVARTPGLDVPSAGYSFEWDDGNGTMYVESYRDETIKSDVLRSIGYFDLKQVAAGLGVITYDVCD